MEDVEGPWLYLNRSLLRRLRLKPAEVEKALADWLAAQRGIQSAYTRTQLLAGVPKEDAVGRMVQRSFHPDRAGDVYYLSSFVGYQDGTVTDRSPIPARTYPMYPRYGGSAEAPAAYAAPPPCCGGNVTGTRATFTWRTYYGSGSETWTK